jgi:hypothetical protein
MNAVKGKETREQPDEQGYATDAAHRDGVWQVHDPLGC